MVRVAIHCPWSNYMFWATQRNSFKSSLTHSLVSPGWMHGRNHDELIPWYQLPVQCNLESQGTRTFDTMRGFQCLHPNVLEQVPPVDFRIKVLPNDTSVLLIYTGLISTIYNVYELKWDHTMTNPVIPTHCICFTLVAQGDVDPLWIYSWAWVMLSHLLPLLQCAYGTQDRKRPCTLLRLLLT